MGMFDMSPDDITEAIEFMMKQKTIPKNIPPVKTKAKTTKEQVKSKEIKP